MQAPKEALVVAQTSCCTHAPACRAAYQVHTVSAHVQWPVKKPCWAESSRVNFPREASSLLCHRSESGCCCVQARDLYRLLVEDSASIRHAAAELVAGMLEPQGRHFLAQV